ncbi:hypothetical protein DINM_005299 [Dirofilaria immitis]|nr:hypothetical protein [Dirofilaria immitis]
MQRPLTLFLWFSYCITLYSGSAMDNDHVTLRVRDAIRRLPYHSKNNSNNIKRKWQHLIRYEIGDGLLIHWGLPREFESHPGRRFVCLWDIDIIVTLIFATKIRSRFKYSSQSVQMADARQAYISSAITNAIFMDNSNEIVFAPTINSSISSGLSPHQQQQQYNTYHYTTQHFRTTNILPSFHHLEYKNIIQCNHRFTTILGIHSDFLEVDLPKFFAPQPQLFISTTLQPVRSNIGLNTKEIRLVTKSKTYYLLQKQNLSPSCQLLCNYDIISDRSLVNAVILNQCPGNELEMAFNCATSMADHSACCIRNGIGTYGNGHCMVFCTTHLGNPRNALQYLDCLQVFDRIKNCYREYHVVNPNIYGNLRSMES